MYGHKMAARKIWEACKQQQQGMQIGLHHRRDLANKALSKLE